jgi:thiol-disulfide isomerase/thioredoxin
VVLYVLMLGGRRLTSRLTRPVGRLQTATGALLIVVAVLMLADVDTRFQTAIADDLPAFLVNPSGGLESSASVHRQLASLHGGSEPLPELGMAPDFVGNQHWFNTTGGAPLSLSELRGKVVLVDFWTYTCINCIRTLPYLKAWYRRYRSDGLVIVGVHTPEFPFERDTGNVRDAIAQNGLRYPVVQDNDYATWNAYGNQYWPAKYLIDARGRVRYTHFGEGSYGRTEEAIRRLLAEAGRKPRGAMARAHPETASPLVTTPESYLGAARAERFANGPIRPGTQTFLPPPGGVRDDHLAFEGTWQIGDAAATAVRGARLQIRFGARRVFVVLGSRGVRASPVSVLIDGRPLPDRLAGGHARRASVVVTRQRLYRLVDLPREGRHLLTLKLPPGVSGYAFTFG